MTIPTPDDLLERAVTESRAQTAVGLRDALRNASAPVLGKLSVDLVSPLFRNEYYGEPVHVSEVRADAIARPHVGALPSFLVRVHRGVFVLEDVDDLRTAMIAANTPQAALVIIGPAVSPDVRNAFGTMVPWLVDLDGLIHLMMTAKVGVGTRVCEVTHVDADYFR